MPGIDLPQTVDLSMGVIVRVATNVSYNRVFAKEFLKSMIVFRMGIEIVAFVPMPSVMVVGDRYDGFVAKHKNNGFGVFLQVRL